MFEKQKEKALDQFLNKLGSAYDTDIDPSGECKEAALAYLEKNHYNPESLDDLSKAFDMLSKNSDRLLTIQEDLKKQGDDPTSIPWVNDEQYQNSLCEHGVLELMIKMQNQPGSANEAESGS